MTDRYKDKIQRYTEYALMAIIALELLFYVYTNLFKLGNIVDVDFARVLRHLTEMGDKRTIFLPYWNYITTAELDHSAIFALPIYIITGNLMVSYGIANLINIAIWCVILYRLLELTDLDRRGRLLAAALVLTIFDFGMLAYTNMLFIGGEHYTHKVFIPLMFILLILTPANRRKNVGTISFALLYFGLLFVTAVSSGIYVFICGIFPVIVCLVYRFITGGKTGQTIYQVIMSACTVLITLAGIIVCKVANVTPNSELAAFKSMENIRGNLFSTFLDLVEMFRVFPEKNVPVMSLSAVMSIVRLFIFLIVLAFGLSSVNKLAATETDKAPGAQSVFAEQLLISVFIWNYFILFVSGSQQRYHIMGAVPLMICAVMEFCRFTDKNKEEVKGIDPCTFLYMMIIGALLLLNLYQVFWGSRQYFKREDYSRAVNAAVISFMEENDAGSAFSLYESGYGTEWLRAADKTRSYETYIPDTGEIINFDFYYSDTDRSAFTDRNVIIATDYEFDSCPAFIKDNYILKGEALNYNLYLSELNPIDGISGPIEGMDTTDLATSPGYEVTGDIDGAGHLMTDKKGEVLISPYMDVTEPCTLTIGYSTDSGADSVVELYAGDELTDSFAINPEAFGVSIELSPGNAYRFVIKKNGTGTLNIGNIEFTH